MPSTNNPDSWVIVEITSGEKTIQKVLAGWYGGYTYGDSWKLSSGIEKIEKDGKFYKITNVSGSVYHCHEDNERMSGYTHSIYSTFEKQVTEAGGAIQIVDIADLDVDEPEVCRHCDQIVSDPCRVPSEYKDCSRY